MKANLIQLYENNSRGNWLRKNVTFSFSAHIFVSIFDLGWFLPINTIHTSSQVRRGDSCRLLTWSAGDAPAAHQPEHDDGNLRENNITKHSEESYVVIHR